MRFAERVALVTGASQGIGRATAEAFAREGARVALISNDPERGHAIEKDLTRAGHQARFFAADVSDESQVRAVVAAVLDAWQQLDILVNNAGIYLQADAIGTTLDDWNRIMAVNLTSSYLFTRYAGAHMVERGRGVIVNVSSEAGRVGIKGQVAYNVSKAGMISLTQSCAVDFADRGVRVNCVCPGTTFTPLVAAALQNSDDPAGTRRQLESARPLDRLGTPDEIAAAILYMASDEAGYTTGAVLSVDGGYTAQ